MSCVKSNKHILYQTWTSSGVLISVVCQGMMMGYTTRLLPEPGSDSNTYQQDVYWIASSPSMALILGILLASIMMEVLGRKFAYVMLMIPGSFSLLQIYTASNGSSILAGKMLSGVSIGGVVTLAAVVIGEYSSPEHRDMFLHLKTAAFALGNTMSRILSDYYEWKTIAFVILILNLISTLIVSSWLESPYWLAMNGELDTSERNFYSLRGRNHNTKAEFEELIRAQSKASLKSRAPYVEIFRKLIKRSFLRPVFIIFMCSMLLEISGRHIIPIYASKIIRELENKSNPSLNLRIDIIITISALISATLIKIMKTRTLLFSTGTASLLTLFSANTYLFLSSNNFISNHSWLPTSMFTLYLILVNLGCTIIPMALLGEIFPLAHKGTGLFVSGILSCICFEGTVRIFPYLLAGLKIYTTFAIIGMVKTVILMILYFVLPETKNKTLQEIEESIQYGRGVARTLPDHDETYKMLS
ncbi:facilitated trehalose transporter Tret1 isoform X2 [Manduca sexta]|uniref:facilitated trehalose transporter Tret1 isoform X2 n=1 Tax=Manduca sexta TaxID=7130 RepID=UPI00188F7643|nr:facilitated trehalose transporter Tret1 isoform X2 [Manduca sexta]